MELLIVVAVIGIIAAIAIPYLMHAKQAARAASAISSLRVIHSSEVTYRQTSGVYGNIAALASAGVLNDPSLIAGSKSDYNFDASASAVPSESYSGTATPAAAASIWNHYYIDESGVIRFEIGTPASASSTPVQ